MPTVIVEGPPLTIERKRALVASVYTCSLSHSMDLNFLYI